MLVYRRGSPRRAPYPFHLKLNGVGLPLAVNRSGAALFTVSEIEDLSSTAPTDYEYSAQNPRIERVQSYDDFSEGFGLKAQREFTEKRYRHTIAADLSVKGLMLKGPSISSSTPETRDSTNGITHFFEIGSNLYALNGRYVLLRTQLGWTVSKDLEDYGAGTTGVDVVTFYSNAEGGTYAEMEAAGTYTALESGGLRTYGELEALSANRAFIALSPSTENFVTFDGTTYMQVSGSDMDARAWAVAGRELYRARDTNYITKCDTDADPKNADNWVAANAFRVGDKSSAITSMAVTAAGELLIFKTDGPYVLQPSGEDRQLFSFLRFAPADTNGLGHGAFLNDVWVPYRSGTYRITPDFGIQQAGPETQYDSDWLISMRVTALLGHDNLHLYAGITDESDSYLMKGVSGPDGRIVWHGSITEKFTGKKITALYKSTAGSAADRAMLYIGFSDGTLSLFGLPNTFNPAADTRYPYTATAGEVYPPLFTGGFGTDAKALHAITVHGPAVTSNRTVTVAYKTDPAESSYTAFSGTFNTTRQKIDFPSGTFGTVVDFKFNLNNTTTALCPQVAGIGIHHTARPERREVYTFTVTAADGLIRRDGVPYRMSASKIRDVVDEARSTSSSVELVLPDGRRKPVILTHYEETEAIEENTRQMRAALRITAIEQSSMAHYSDLEALGTYAQLEAAGSYAALEAAA